jgi:hypothetical protein
MAGKSKMAAKTGKIFFMPANGKKIQVIFELSFAVVFDFFLNSRRRPKSTKSIFT